MSDQDKAVDLRAASTDDLKDMGLPPNFTLEELKGFLSEAELKALQDDEDPLFNTDSAGGEAEAEASDQPEADDDDGNEDGDEPDSDAAENKGGEEGGGTSADDDAGDSETSGQPDQGTASPTFVEAVADSNEPVLKPIDVTAARAIVDGAAAERKALMAKFDDGELSEADFDAELEKLTDKIADARADIRVAEKQTVAQVEAYRNAWYAKTGDFMTKNPSFADNEPVAQLGGASRLQLFDEALKRVTGDPGYASLSMSDKINTAAKMAAGYFKQETGEDLIRPRAAPAAKAGNETAAKPVKPAAQAAQAAPKRPDPGKRPDPVRTLGGVTTASTMEADDGRFAAIDRAGGVAAEQEFARMSQAERDAYLRGA